MSTKLGTKIESKVVLCPFSYVFYFTHNGKSGEVIHKYVHQLRQILTIIED